MTKFSHIIFITLVTFSMVTGEEQSNESKYKLTNNKKLKATFNKLLKTVTSVNEERLDAVKKFYELQNYLPKVERSGGKPLIAVIVPNRHKNELVSKNDFVNIYKTGTNQPRETPELDFFKSEKDGVDVDNINNNVISEDDVDVTNFLRAWKGCNKSAAKTCKKACKKAFTQTCSDYKCSKSMKRSGKRACKRVCNSQFGYRDDD